MNRIVKYKAWIKNPKECWLGVDNYDTFDWDNRMRQVSSIHFPLNKFSGKDITCEPICENDNYARGWHGSVYKDFNSLPESIEYELIEFTNLYDINGKEIYETDIIKFNEDYRHQNYRGNIGIITWDNNRACFFIDVKYSGYSKSCIYDLTDLHSNTRIIGNLFETPELLKV